MQKKRSLGVRLVEGFLHLHGLLPLPYHYFQAGILAWFLDRVLHYRRDVVTVNLSRSFPEKSYEELKEIRKRFYRHFATTLTESVWFGACKGEKGRKRLKDSHLVEITNPEELNRLWNASRQLMILEAHTGNWELFGGILNYSYAEDVAFLASEIAVTFMRLSSAVWDRVMEDNRTAPVADLGFDGYVETREVLRFALGNKDRKYVYTFITDQYPYTYMQHPEVDFMQQKTATMTAAASLACKLDMAVTYLRFRCREDGGYTMTFVPLSDHAHGQEPLNIMKQYYKLLEEDLREQPWNYLWTHKRWKKR